MTNTKEYQILTINPGSTSTKIAIYENEIQKHKQSIEHSSTELSRFKSIADQYLMRKKAVVSFLEQINYDPSKLACIVGRGGALPPLKAGAYLVNEAMLDTLRNRPQGEHVSNLGAMIAYEIGIPLGIPVYIYDGVSVDEFEDVARITGLPEIRRVGLSHVLNMRAAAMKFAQVQNRSYRDMNLLVVHMGGGITLSVHKKGRMIDFLSDDEGPFAPERAGRVPGVRLIDLCFSGKYDCGTMKKMIRGKGGLTAHLNTNSALEIERRIKNGDDTAGLVYNAMAYQVAKGIGELAVVVNGEVDRIILTGGLAYSELLTGWIKERIRFIAEVEVMPGENELESMALGALRVLRGEETAHVYAE